MKKLFFIIMMLFSVVVLSETTKTTTTTTTHTDGHSNTQSSTESYSETVQTINVQPKKAITDEEALKIAKVLIEEARLLEVKVKAKKGDFVYKPSNYCVCPNYKDFKKCSKEVDEQRYNWLFH